METVLESPTKSVVIGPDRPFVIIGERINPTGRKALAAELQEGNFDRVRADATAQVEAGAAMLDVNSGVPGADAAKLLVEMVTPMAREVALQVHAELEARAHEADSLRGQRVERAGPGPVVRVALRRDRVAPAARRDPPHRDQPTRVRVGQWLEQHGVHHAEHGGIDAYAYGQCRDHEDREECTAAEPFFLRVSRNS